MKLPVTTRVAMAVMGLVFSPLTMVGAENPTAHRLNKAGIAFCETRDSTDDADCYDPVSYFKGGPKKIDKSVSGKFRTKVGLATYVFGSEENLSLFEKEPTKYLPAFGGWCAYAVSDYSGKVDVDPKSYHIQNGRLLLFYDGLWADTRKKWLTDKAKSPAEYLMKADTNWPSTISKEPK